IRVIDLAAGTVSTVMFPNPQALQIADRITVVGGNSGLGDTLALDTQTVAPGEGELVLRIVLPDGYKINADAPSQVDWASSGDAVQPSAEHAPFDSTELRLPVTLAEGEATL